MAETRSRRVAMASPLARSLDADTGRQDLLAARCRPAQRAMSLHISKLRGITEQVRQKLKRQVIVYTHQLIAAAHDRRRCRRLAALGDVAAQRARAARAARRRPRRCGAGSCRRPRSRAARPTLPRS
jgi:hypothetical protein